MLRNLIKLQPHERSADAVDAWTDWSLQFVLWTLWTLTVIAVGYFSWRADVVAQRPIDTLGLAIHCLVTGVIGLIVVTKIEMWLELRRFLGD